MRNKGVDVVKRLTFFKDEALATFVEMDFGQTIKVRVKLWVQGFFQSSSFAPGEDVLPTSPAVGTVAVFQIKHDGIQATSNSATRYARRPWREGTFLVERKQKIVHLSYVGLYKFRQFSLRAYVSRLTNRHVTGQRQSD